MGPDSQGALGSPRQFLSTRVSAARLVCDPQAPAAFLTFPSGESLSDTRGISNETLSRIGAGLGSCSYLVPVDFWKI